MTFSFLRYPYKRRSRVADILFEHTQDSSTIIIKGCYTQPVHPFDLSTFVLYHLAFMVIQIQPKSKWSLSLVTNWTKLIISCSITKNRDWAVQFCQKYNERLTQLTLSCLKTLSEPDFLNHWKFLKYFWQYGILSTIQLCYCGHFFESFNCLQLRIPFFKSNLEVTLTKRLIHWVVGVEPI